MDDRAAAIAIIEHFTRYTLPPIEAGCGVTMFLNDQRVALLEKHGFVKNRLYTKEAEALYTLLKI